ncbi:isoprenylcysteine carboxylmethyltransferase family protein [candidate division KSB1 bacterium]|nr:isoprenylcysteine carboxylmethyltransferase family protein [candidate division KSB1 bacterium]
MLLLYFKIIYLLGLVSGSVIRVRYTGPHKKDNASLSRETLTDKLLLIPPGLGFIVIPLLYIFTSRLAFADVRLKAGLVIGSGIAGTLVFAAALWLLWRSHADLGRNWTATLLIKNNHTLITKGIYSYIRHPMYAGHWLWGVAQFLLLHNWIAGPAMLVTMLPFYLYRVPREEKMMLEKFGEDYRTYVSKTGGILPVLSLLK